MADRRRRFDWLWCRAELRLLHRQLQPGVSAHSFPLPLRLPLRTHCADCVGVRCLSLTEPWTQRPLVCDRSWPKFANNIVLASPADGGAVVGLLAPADATLVRGPQRHGPPSNAMALTTSNCGALRRRGHQMALITSGRVRQPNGELSIVTDYPFGDVVTVTATFTKAAPLRIRIPGWATKATVDGKPAANGTLHLVQIPAGTATTVTVDFKPEVRVEDGWGSAGNAPAGLPGGMAVATNAATVLRGALVYSLQLVEEFSSIKQWCPPPPTFTSRFRFRARLSTGPFFREPFLNHDYNINTPSTWNYALDLSDPDALTFERAGATWTILQHYGPNHLGLW